MIKGVVFDMDGLMLDSEVLYESTSLSIMAEMGVEPCREIIMQSIGLPEESWSKIIYEHYGEGFDMLYFKERCLEKMNVWYNEGDIPTKPGLFELLDYLRDKGIVCAVASSTYEVRASAVLARLGIAPYMVTGVFGNMVEHGKPAPDIFAEAVRRLGLDPAECMGLEDSHNGLRSSKGAGLYTVMVPDLLQPTEEISRLIDDCVDSLADVIPLIERLNQQ